MGAAIVIVSGGLDLSPGAVIALTGVVAGKLFVEGGHALGTSLAAALRVGVLAGAVNLERRLQGVREVLAKQPGS